LELPIAESTADTRPVSAGSRRVFHAGAWKEVPVFNRDRLAVGNEITGPALIAQPDSTIFVLANWHLRVDPTGSLMATHTTPQEV